MKPYKSAILIWQAAHLKCPNGSICMFCEYIEFCKTLNNAYKEAKKILPNEIIASLEEERKKEENT